MQDFFPYNHYVQNYPEFCGGRFYRAKFYAQTEGTIMILFQTSTKLTPPFGFFFCTILPRLREQLFEMIEFLQLSYQTIKTIPQVFVPR